MSSSVIINQSKFISNFFSIEVFNHLMELDFFIFSSYYCSHSIILRYFIDSLLNTSYFIWLIRGL